MYCCGDVCIVVEVHVCIVVEPCVFCCGGSCSELLLAGGHVDVRAPDDQPLAGGLLGGGGPVSTGLGGGRHGQHVDIH